MAHEYRTKREKVYFNIQDEIIKGAIRPGARLIISQLAKRFNVSEIPVREALQVLAQEGYALLTPHSGFIVSSMSEEDIRQIFEIRINLESLASRLAVNHLTLSHIKSLEEMIEQSKIYLEHDDLLGYWDFNRSFHEFIYQHSNNERLSNMISELYDFSKRFPSFFSNLEDIELSIREHKEIVDALSDRNEDLVEKLMRAHTERSYHHIIELVHQVKKE